MGEKSEDARRVLIQHLQDLRRGSAAQPIPSKNRYVRKVKHNNRGEDDDC